ANLVARPIAAGTQLVVGGALLRIAQCLIRFVDCLELLLGAGFLAYVRMELARHPAIGGLDLRLACAGLDAEGFVVILEMHSSLQGIAAEIRAMRESGAVVTATVWLATGYSLRRG